MSNLSASMINQTSDMARSRVSKPSWALGSTIRINLSSTLNYNEQEYFKRLYSALNDNSTFGLLMSGKKVEKAVEKAVQVRKDQEFEESL